MKKIVAVLLISMFLISLSSCSFTTNLVMNLVEEERYEDAYKLASLLGDEELLGRFYWVPVEVKSGDEVYYHTFNEDNLPLKFNYSDEYYDEFYYDEYGRLVKVLNVEEDYTIVSEYIFDEEGRLIKDSCTVVDLMDFHYEYNYNEDGLLVSMISYGTFDERCVIEMVYDKKGQVIKEISRYESGRESVVEYGYDERGNRVYSKSPYFDGTIQTITYAYDEHDRMIVERTEYSDGIYYEYTNTYDEQGRIVRTDYKSGFSLDSVDSVASHEYEYDEHGNVIKYTETDDGVVCVNEITYKLVYIPYDYDEPIDWTLNEYTPFKY